MNGETPGARDTHTLPPAHTHMRPPVVVGSPSPYPDLNHQTRCLNVSPTFTLKSELQRAFEGVRETYKIKLCDKKLSLDSAEPERGLKPN